MPLRPLLVVLCLLALFAGASVATARDDGQRQKGGNQLKPVAGLTLTGTTRTTLSIDWLAATQGKPPHEYDLFVDGAAAGSTTETQATLTGFRCETDHVIGVRARDAKSRLSAISELRASTAECDHTPPTLPSELRVVDVLETGFTIVWSPSTDEEGVAGYDVSLDGTAAGSTTSTSHAFSGLSCGQTHKVSIVARDVNDNRSAAADLSASTAECPDRAAPTAPAGLMVTDILETGFTVVWQPSTDDRGVVGYDVSLDGTSVGSETGTSHAFIGLSCGRTHKVSIVARDAAGNSSATAEIGATTAECPPPPPPAADLFVSPDGADTLQRWRYMATTYDGNTLRLYVDGLEVGHKDISGYMQPSDGAVRMGSNRVYASREPFAGLLDEVRLFGRALSPQELRTEMTSATPQATGLAGAYSFDEGTGDQTRDSSANANNGVISGATWSSEGRFGGALSFDGVDDMVSVADADSLDFTDGMTLAGWVKPTSSNGWQTVVTKEAGPEEVYGLWAATDDKVPSGHVTVGIAYEARGPAPLTLNDCRSTPCASLGAAYLSARRGEVVQLANGTYAGDQLIPADAMKPGDGIVLFRPAAGAVVTIQGEVFVDGSHVEFRDMRMSSGWQTRAGADDITFRDVSSAHLFIFSSSNVNVLGGSIGPGDGVNFDSLIASASGGAAPPTNILIKGVNFHDWIDIDPNQANHIECLQIGSAVNLTITGNRFQRCATHDIFIRSWGPVNGSESPLRNIVIENNFLDATEVGFYTLSAQNDLGTERANFVIRNNSSLQAMNLDGANAEITVDSNILAFQQGIGCTATSYSYNVIEEGAVCGATDLVAAVAYVDRENLDLHLAPGSAAIGRGNPLSFPAVDLDGDARPLGDAPDAGADERG